MFETSSVVLRNLGQREYSAVADTMRSWTKNRVPSTVDEIWSVEHPALYTRGANCKSVPRPLGENIPLVDTDRGGQITYHGPGQLLIYFMIDLKKLEMGVRALVRLLESSVIRFLKTHEIIATSRRSAPGVYVENSKLAAIGLRIHAGHCYHGLSLNIDMDLSPFRHIDPCGHADLSVTQLRALGVKTSLIKINQQITNILVEELGYEHIIRGEARLPTCTLNQNISK